MAHESLVDLVAEHEVQTEWGPVTAKVLRSGVDHKEHLAIVKGNIDPDVPTLIRVQSVDLPADLVGLALSGGGTELRAAMKLIAESDTGVFVYLVRDGGEETLSEKLLRLQAEGDQPNHPRLGGRMDLRQFGVGAQILKSLGVKKFRLMSNRDVRIVGIEGFDLEMIERVPLPM
jgi:3,4-dihydroxy 2-butanone 4-phosphate synthase/GTP cyclohydrolase II